MSSTAVTRLQSKRVKRVRFEEPLPVYRTDKSRKGFHRTSPKRKRQVVSQERALSSSLDESEENSDWSESIDDHQGFVFSALPAVAKRQILLFLMSCGPLPHLACVCWLWSRLFTDEPKEEFLRLAQRERALQTVFSRAVHQSEITRDMWPQLFDWLVDVAEEFELRPATLHTAVGYLRWHLSKQEVRRSEFQLLGASCLFVAAKFFEKDDDVPSVHDLVYMGDQAFTHQAVLNAEVKLIHVLGFDLQFTTPLSFLQVYCDTLRLRARGNDAKIFWLAVMLIELAQLRTSTLRLRPSVVSAAALVVAAGAFIGMDAAGDLWECSLGLLSGMRIDRAPLCNAITSVVQLRVNPPSVPGHQLLAVYNKFAGAAYCGVSSIQLATQ